MRLSVWHWAAAVLVSLGAHAALLAAFEPLPDMAEERAQGLPDVVWGVAAQEIPEPVTPAEAAEGAPEAVKSVEPVEEDAAETHEPAQDAAETAADAEPAETEDAAPAAPARALAEQAQDSAPDDADALREPAMSLPERKPEAPPERRRAAPAQRASPSGGPAGQDAGAQGRRTQTAGRAELSDYSGRVLAHLRRHKRYPRAAGRAQGTVRLTFSVGARGELRSVRIAGASGHAALDREALAMARRATPYPPIPPGLQRPTMTFTVPIRFAR